MDGVFADTPEIYNPTDGLVTAVTPISTTQLREEEYPANFHLPNGMLLAISPGAWSSAALGSKYKHLDKCQHHPGDLRFSGPVSPRKDFNVGRRYKLLVSIGGPNSAP